MVPRCYQMRTNVCGAWRDVESYGSSCFMKLQRIREILNADIITGEALMDSIDVDRCYSADLMSDVLGRPHANSVLLTGLTNPQAVRTAEVADIKAVFFVRGKRPDIEAVALAQKKDIPLFVTRYTMFEACGLLYMNGLRGVPE